MITVVILLVVILKDQVEQLRSIGIRVVAIGVDEGEGKEEAAKNGVCEIVYGSPESLGMTQYHGCFRWRKGFLC